MSEWGDVAGVVRLPDGRCVRGSEMRRPRAWVTEVASRLG